MKHSDSHDMDLPVPNLAMGYFPAPLSPLGWRDTSFEHVMRGGPAGGGFSTVADLHRFALALQQGKLLKPASVQRLWQNNQGFGYGYGFSSQVIAGQNVVGHGGGFPGISADLSMWPHHGYIFSTLSNHDAVSLPVDAATAANGRTGAPAGQQINPFHPPQHGFAGRGKPQYSQILLKK